ncbi:MAG: hypothetical protein OER95_05440 [Acidimicrobiia bacterium]|nr:hypothetical protein [Acidimicrobiia bacterium]
MSQGALHEVLGWTVVLSNGLVGLWALAAHWVETLRGRWLWVATAAAQVLIFLQVVLGVVYLNSSGIEVAGIHQFYGYITLMSVALIYSYRQQIDQWKYLLYGFGGLFIMGLALRTVFIPT